MLAWNLFHGRSLPPGRRGLEAQFARLLAAWEWDVALLQEVPPWWPPRLARAARAEQVAALTSRNAGLALRRAIAARRPELLKSNGGGCNAILARRRIAAHERLRLRLWPERRVAQLARLADGVCVVNYHGSSGTALAEQELERLWRAARAWAEAAPLVLGGDLNLRLPQASPDCRHVAARDVDHIFACGFASAEPAELMPRAAPVEGRARELSDHVPLRVRLQPQISM